jgi:hypothetical protein
MFRERAACTFVHEGPCLSDILSGPDTLGLDYHPVLCGGESPMERRNTALRNKGLEAGRPSRCRRLSLDLDESQQ